jgi:O-antigen/teichoic acid export membrane protein
MKNLSDTAIQTIKSLFDFKNGHARSIKIKKNIYASFFIKGTSIVIGFIFIRVALEYLDKERYGIWLTLASFLQWYSFFELGLGNGLRNKLAQALATSDFKMARTYVSTTYFLLAFIVIVLSGIFFMINPFLNWSSILNASPGLKQELFIISTVVFGCFFIQFVLNLIEKILFADQMPAMANAIYPVSSFLNLAVIYLLSKFTEGNLLYLSLVLSINPIFVYIIYSIWLFTGRYKKISPSWKCIEWKYGKSLISLGVNFFVIGISNLVILKVSNILIAHMFSLSDVTVYNVAYKLFATSTMVFTIIVSPLWSAYTEAWVKNEKDWIRKNIDKMQKIWFGMLIFNLVVLFASPFIFRIWLGDQVKVPFTLSIGLVLFFSVMDYGRIYLLFNNGISKLRVQMYGTVIGAVIFLPLCFLFIDYFHWGLYSIPIAMLLSQFKNYILAPIQYKKLINNTATGIWNK